MRRALILPTVTILLLLGLCIANGLLLRQHTDRWSGMAAETARYARSERWPEARRELDALAADWDEAQSYLHIVVPQHLRRGADAADPLPYPVRYRGLTGSAAGAGRVAMSAGCAGCAGAHQHSEYPVIIFR